MRKNIKVWGLSRDTLLYLALPLPAHSSNPLKALITLKIRQEARVHLSNIGRVTALDTASCQSIRGTGAALL